MFNLNFTQMRKKLLLPFTHWRKAQRVLLLLVGVLGVILPASAQTQVYSNDFLNQDDFNTMTVIDANGDSYTWAYYNSSARIRWNSNKAADDWLITPGINLEAGKTYQFEIDAKAETSTYHERLEVKMGTTPAAASMTTDVIAQTEITSTSLATLSNNTITVASTGVYYFGIHAISDKDMYYLTVDNLVITNLTPDLYAKPTNLAVNDVTHNSATATWTGNNDAQSYNLRYRKRVPSWNFEDAAQFNEFIIVDNDGDNYNWEYYNNAGLTQGVMAAHGGDGLIISESYDNDAGLALSPDNWLISQVIDLGGTLTFWAAGQDSNYPAEKFGLFVCTSNSTNPADFTQVDTDKTATATYTKYSFDLSQYAGQTGRFAIVHHNVSDMFILKVDDIEITGMSDSEWTIVNGLTASQYNIEGLAHSTQYEVQVQAVYADGTSDWTNSVNFTTLAVPYVNPPVNLEAEGNASGAIEMNWEMPVICTEDFDDTATFPEFSLGGITSTEHSGTIGNWTLYDANGTTTYGFQSYTVPNLGEPMGWIVFAPGSDQLETSLITSNPPHSGSQYMASFCVTSGATDHWLISPLLNGEEQTISFFARELTTQYGDETFEVLASSTDNSPASFTSVVSLSSNSTNWTEYTASLPAGAKYFAIRHTSNDIFALYVDDVTFIPADPNASTLPAPDAFNIYLDGELVATVNGDVMTYTIPNVDPGQHECSVTAVYDDLESDSATATAIVPVPQSMTLAALVADGEVGIRYTISEPLLVVRSNGNSIWLKDADGSSILKTSPAEGYQNYSIVWEGNPHENQADYDQSNWIEVQLADGSEDVVNLVGNRIKADKITGTFSNKTNPTMTGVTLVEGDYEITAGEDEYMLNYYCTANFDGSQPATIGTGAGTNYFFMNPKPQECAFIIWAKYDAANGKMIMPSTSEGNGHGFHGEFEVDLSLNIGTSPEDGKTYNFDAIVRMIEPTGGNMLRENNSNGYIVYPLNLSEPVVTGINDVTGKAVAGVKYYNVAGIESDRPFDGVNIIVTTYTDGSRSSAKVLK